MANKVSLSLVLGGAVAASVGNAFRTVEGGIDKLAKKGEKAKVLKSTIGETMKLQTEWKRAHDTGAATADKLLRKLNTGTARPKCCCSICGSQVSSRTISSRSRSP